MIQRSKTFLRTQLPILRIKQSAPNMTSHNKCKLDSKKKNSPELERRDGGPLNTQNEEEHTLYGCHF